MTESRVLIFAGTTEGRRLAEYLAEYKVRVHVCAATEYGESLLPDGGSITVSHRRMDEEQMRCFIREFSPDYVADATHPYAQEATENIRKACEACGRQYLRLIRESSETDGCIYTDNIKEAVDFLRAEKGNILAATGSKELEAYTKLEDYKERVFARVLSVSDVVEKCEQLGIRGRHLICMQGPFSVEMNTAVLREYQIDWLVTKESGKTGGFPEKCKAAEQAGARVIVVGRPKKEEDGYSLEELCDFLRREIGFYADGDKGCREISLVGIGTGHRDYFTREAEKVCAQADIVIGAKRMVRAAALNGQAVLFEYRPSEIAAYIKEHPKYRNIAVVFSGDAGFYSGAKKIRAVFESDKELGRNVHIKIVPGISSVVYFSARLCVSWEDAALISMHGRKDNLISHIRDYEKVFVLVSDAQDIRKIGRMMTDYGYGGLAVCIGISLSYPDEKIVRLMAKELCGYEGGGLAVLYVCNPEGGKRRVAGMPDEAFIRGNVPMTKAEVRSVGIAKLCLKRDSIVYDIGAGTGSVAIEAALHAVKGSVYAIETKEEAVALIQKNRQKFKTDNLSIIQGEAPEALEGLLLPDCVFIGGSGGKLREILWKIMEDFSKAGKEDGKVCIVINCITLETLSEAVECLGELRGGGQFMIEEEEIAQLSLAKSKHVGKYHMMMGQNPIFMISFHAVSIR